MKIKQYSKILLIAVLLMAQSLFAQSYEMVIVENDGTIVRKTVSDIDRVFFQDTGTVTDIDGNTYITIQIGDLWWMAENLKTTKYRDGTAIPIEEGDAAWTALSTGAYCYYDNNAANAETYGALYNWYAVDNSSGLAPTGWRVPTDDDWKTLERYLGMDQLTVNADGWRGTDEGTKLKSTSGWSNNGNGTDEVRFAGLPGGCRDFLNGYFSSIETGAYFWSASEGSTSEAWRRELFYSRVDVGRYGSVKKDGFSVRCVKDAAP